MDGCQNTLDADSSVLTESLDESERRIFQRGSVGQREYSRWEQRDTEKLAPSVMVANMRKRKRAQMNDDDK